MERGGDLEFGEVELIQGLSNFVENEDNHTDRFSSSFHRKSEIMLSTMVGDTNMIQDSVVQRLLDRVKKEESHINQFSPSIYMAPRTLRDMSPSSFNPLVVSIGPLHREDEKVQAFEVRKTSYLIDLMRRAKSPQQEILKLCVEKVYTSMEKIKACNVWTKPYGDIEIVDMMIMDACFILEFLIKFWISKERSEGVLQHNVIFYDLILLENQIPFFILAEIFQCTVLQFRPNVSLLKLISPILFRANIFKDRININNISVNNTHHILSLLHQCYKPPDYIKKCNLLKSTIPSVVNLDRAGVNFKPNKDPTWLMGMEVELYMFPCFFGSLISKPTLRIPVLKIFYSTEIVLRNLIAYEQSGRTHSYVTSYIAALDMLVDTQEDVAKLVDSRILVNGMGSNDEAANIINNLSNGAVLVDFFYEEQWGKLSKYCDAYWPKNIANMRRTYFSSPWNMIALVAGIILFTLTVVQTIFTIKST